MVCFVPLFNTFLPKIIWYATSKDKLFSHVKTQSAFSETPVYKTTTFFSFAVFEIQ